MTLFLVCFGAFAETDAEKVQRLEQEVKELKQQNAALKIQLSELKTSTGETLKEGQGNELMAFKRAADKKNAARETNLDRAYRAWLQAHQAGRDFVLGRTPNVKADDLFAPLKENEHIWNVIYDRQYRDKRNNPAEEQVTLDKSRLTLKTYGAPVARDGVAMFYGMTENQTVPIMMARKFIKPEESDKDSLGGTITVIVKAEKEN